MNLSLLLCVDVCLLVLLSRPCCRRSSSICLKKSDQIWILAIKIETLKLWETGLAESRQTTNHFSSLFLSFHYVPQVSARLEIVLTYSDCGKMCYWLVTTDGLQYFYPIVLFWRQWKSISMFWCFLSSSIVSVSGTPCCVLEKTMIMFLRRKIFRIKELFNISELFAMLCSQKKKNFISFLNMLKYMFDQLRNEKMLRISILFVLESLNPTETPASTYAHQFTFINS